MKIYITGASGMVGRNLLENLFIEKQKVLMPTSKELNLTDFSATNKFISENRPDFIIHTAGRVGGIQANIKDPYNYLMDNMVMGMNIVRAAIENGVKNLINLSSSCAYPQDAPNPLTEESVLKGTFEPTNEGYALAKVSVLRACEFASKQMGVNYKTLIPCNLYGRWDKFGEHNSHMLPAVIKKIHSAKKDNIPTVEIWSDGTARREFMYAADLADLIAYSIQHFDKLPIVMNAGVGYDFTVNEFYHAVAKVAGYSGSFTHDLTKPAGIKQKLLNITRQNEFGFKPRHSLEDGIRKTYEFYVKNEVRK
jgi:GDP-L-fucose synthase